MPLKIIVDCALLHGAARNTGISGIWKDLGWAQPSASHSLLSSTERDHETLLGA